jgi:hypothetical protein
MSLPFMQPYMGLGNSLQTAQASGGGAGGIGGWVELARTTLGSNGQTITVSSIPDKRYYMILHNYKLTGASTGGYFQVGNSTIDTGSNYARRYSNNGAADGTNVNHSNLMDVGGYSDTKEFGVSYIANLAAKEKLHIGHYNFGLSGAAAAPSRREWATKWTNTSNVIDIVKSTQGGSDNYTSGDEVVVLGWDPEDTHTTNFWEELASVDLSGGAADTISASIADKKYLWIQAYIEGTATAEGTFRVGNTSLDTGNNYSYRYSSNGGADTTDTSSSSMTGAWTVGADLPIFWNIFIINNASNEKLAIFHGVRQNAAGAGTAPSRFEIVGKWSETSNQIGIVGFDNTGTGDYNTNCTMKVWGSD